MTLWHFLFLFPSPLSFVALWHSFPLPTFLFLSFWPYDTLLSLLLCGLMTLSLFLPSFSSPLWPYDTVPLSISPFLCGLMTIFPSSCLPFLLWDSWIHIQGWRPGTSALQREGNRPCSPCTWNHSQTLKLPIHFQNWKEKLPALCLWKAGFKLQCRLYAV